MTSFYLEAITWKSSIIKKIEIRLLYYCEGLNATVFNPSRKVVVSNDYQGWFNPSLLIITTHVILRKYVVYLGYIPDRLN